MSNTEDERDASLNVWLMRVARERNLLVAFARQVKGAHLISWGSERIAELQKEAGDLVAACDKTDRAP